MDDLLEKAAVVALLRETGITSSSASDVLAQAGSALAALRSRQGLLAELSLKAAASEVEAWERDGMRLVALLDSGYPPRLLGAHDRPPLLFVSGHLPPADQRAIAVIGSRAASAHGLAAASSLTSALVARGFTIVSGLAAGIDTAAHTCALARGGRTIAVIATGLRRCFPSQNRLLQEQIAARGAVISRFWPQDPPSRRSFALLNALMSGLSLANVVVEAGERSGCRTQVRAALAHGRPVFLRRPVLHNAWARELARRPGVWVYDHPEEVIEAAERLAA